MSTLDYQSPDGSDSSDSAQLSDESKLSQLKKLLMGDEQSSISHLDSRLSEVERSRALIDSLRQRLADLESDLISREELQHKLAQLQIDAEQISHLLPGAVQKASIRDDKLGNALSPTIANAFQESVRRDPESLVDAIAPIMGPAIRRSISQAMAGMMQSLNQTLDHSFSPRGLKWRWEALTTGKPFAEVVLIHSLVYLVEHVFLIRREDGIVLAHTSSLAENQTDPDLVSGMLTALQDFVRDSLGGQQSDTLDDMRVGDRNIFIAHGADAIVAGVVRGMPPESIRETLQEACERVHLDYANELKTFDGDTELFAPVEYELRDCLQSAYQDEQPTAKPAPNKWRSRLAWGIAGLLLFAAVVWLGIIWRHRRIEYDYHQLLATPESVELDLSRGVLSLSGEAHDDWIRSARTAATALQYVDRIDTSQLVNVDQPWLDCLQALRDEPGIVVTQSSREGRIYYVEGLQDPLAKSAGDIIRQAELPEGQVRSRFTSYHSMERPFVMSRLQQALGDVETVHWTEAHGALKATGSASHAWCTHAKQYAEQTRGFRIDVSAVVDVDRTAMLEQIQALEKQSVMYQDGTAKLAEGQDGLLDTIASQIGELVKAAAVMDQSIHVVVMGYADDEESSETPPQRLSELRARFAWKELTVREVSPEWLLVRARGAGQLPANDDGLKPDMRRCMFSVKLGA